MTAAVSVDFSLPVRWILLRSLLAWAIIAAAAISPHWWTAAGLVGCVWIDAFAGWHAKRTQVTRSRFAIACELLADFLCFVWAPVMWITAHGAPWQTWLAAGVFVLAGAFRLARFQVEGFVRGGYRGLPVTYCGYAVPLIGVLVEFVLRTSAPRMMTSVIGRFADIPWLASAIARFWSVPGVERTSSTQCPIFVGDPRPTIPVSSLFIPYVLIRVVTAKAGKRPAGMKASEQASGA